MAEGVSGSLLQRPLPVVLAADQADEEEAIGPKRMNTGIASFLQAALRFRQGLSCIRNSLQIAFEER